jgi:6-phosphogluconate dehydrogenase
MQIGLIGLGKMGYNLALNFKSKGFSVLAYDENKSVTSRISNEGIGVAASLVELTTGLTEQTRIIWIMVPSGAVDQVIGQLKGGLKTGDIIIDGGNSHYKESIARATSLAQSGIHFLDCGTSGGVNGALHGVCTMVGGDQSAFMKCEDIFRKISVPDGSLYCGKSGSGHFVKMIHNGIEYGMMQSIAEGMELLHRYDPEVKLESVAKVWNHGSVVRGWLMELTQSALQKDKNLSSIKGVMHSSGEGRWTVETGLELNVPTPVITMSLMMRYRSQTEDTFSGKVVAALRNEFGGHAVEKSDK